VPGPCPIPDPFPELAEAVRARVKALEAAGGFADWKGHWRGWVEVRRLAGSHAPAAGAEYCEQQLLYHYTKSREALAEAVAALRASAEGRVEGGVGAGVGAC
jgi:hypothetical protein